MESELSWSYDGGMRAYDDTSTLGPCAAFSDERTSFMVGGETQSCSTELSGCAGAIIAALANEDVAAPWPQRPCSTAAPCARSTV